MKTKDKLQLLYAEYSKKLPNKIHAIEEQWKSLSQHWSREGAEGFHRLVHGLCGSAGTYGYHELSVSAREFEVYLKTLVDKAEISDADVYKINGLMNRLIKTFLVSAKTELSDDLPGKIEVRAQNKMVYSLEGESRFVDEVRKNLIAMGCLFEGFHDVSLFNEALNAVRPSVAIIDADYLGDNEIAFLKKLHEGDFPVVLYCVSSRGDLQTRLKSVRAGASAFFLKTGDPFYLTKMIGQQFSEFDTEPLRILVVDDSSSLAEYYSIVLQSAGMNAHYITNPLHMLEVLNDFRPNLLLLDVYMPECSGLELAAVLRQEPIYAGIPIIFLSTEEDRYKQLVALNLGGDDFLTKPILPQHLVDAVRSRAKRAGILSTYMTRDSLTGLLNHTNVLQHLEIELSRAGRLSSSLCFVMIDIDHFKLINDKYGHAVGDHVLRKLSEILLTRLRKTDLAGRYGGEEFAVILPNTSIDIAVKLCEEIRVLFSHCVFKTEDGQEFSVTFSAGIASYPEMVEAKNLIEAADRALYQAKHQGRNREVVFRL